MKKLILLFIGLLFLVGCSTQRQGLQFAGRTKHKPLVYNMKVGQANKAIKGKNMYVRVNGKVVKNKPIHRLIAKIG